MRAFAKGRFGLESAPIRRSDGLWAHTSPVRFPSFAHQEIGRACCPHLDYLAARRAEIVKVVDGNAARAFPSMDLGRLLPMLHTLAAARAGVRQFAAKVLGDLRAKDVLNIRRKSCMS